MKRIEQETIVIFNEEEPTASVQIYNSRLKKKLEKAHAERPSEVFRDAGGDYIIPKSWIKINPTRILSEKERQRRAEKIQRRV